MKKADKTLHTSSTLHIGLQRSLSAKPVTSLYPPCQAILMPNRTYIPPLQLIPPRSEGIGTVFVVT